MPEITSAETIRAKLREFESRVDGAITAANVLNRIKTDAAKLLNDIQGTENKSVKNEAKIQASLEKTEGARSQLTQLQNDWKTLKQQVDLAQSESRKIGDTLLSSLDLAIQSLDKKVIDAEERLKTTNETSLAKQADLLGRLAANTQTNADVAEKSRSFVAETEAKLHGLLATLQDELQAEVQDKFATAEKRLASETQRIEQHLQQVQKTLHDSVESKAQNYQRLLREEMGVFKAEMQRNLAAQEQSIDRRLTDFLNKQNAMVQNLSQQIDSFNRASQAQSANLHRADAKIVELAAAFGVQKETAARELLACTGNVAELRTLLMKTQAQLGSQEWAMTAVKKTSQDTAIRLDETLDKLRKSIITGRIFK